MTPERTVADASSTVPGAPPWRIGVDVGGTFTDVVVIDRDARIGAYKSPSRPDDPASGVVVALELAAAAVGVPLSGLLSKCALLVHGSTVATNTILEHTGAVVGLLATDGFRDSLEIRRGIRRNPWDHRTPYPPVLVPRYLRLPVGGRIDRLGREHTPLDEESVRRAVATLAAEDVESVAVCFLNSYLDPAHERRAAELVREAMPAVWVSVSSDLIPIAGEYARLSTTVVDAYVGPRLISYLRNLAATLADLGLAGPMLFVKNNGGTAALDEVVREPVTLTLSGPAAAVGALRHVRRAVGGGDLISLEIGGTSCDVVMMVGGEIAVTDELSIGDYDTLVPSVEVHTVGAGGGAIAGVDRAGVLYAGPRGAGAVPGPACYGLGGVEPTVTDAQLVLGRLRAGSYAGGALSLDAGLAHAAIEEKVAGPLGIPLDDAAAGIIRVAEQRMLHAVGFVSIQRGIDPRGFTLVAAGGAGGLHGAPVGRVLGCPVVYVPRLAGVFCALGMLNSDVRHDYVRAFNCPLDDADPTEIERRFATLAAEARATLGREGFADERVRIERELDLRYHSQQWDVRVRLPDGAALDADAVRARFEDSYDRLYGHRQPETRIEIVKLRLACFGQLPELPVPDGAVALSPPEPVETRSVYIDEESGMRDVPIYAGRDLACGHLLAGPLVVEEETTTIFAGLGDRLEIDRAGNYLIRIGAEGGGNGA